MTTETGPLFDATTSPNTSTPASLRTPASPSARSRAGLPAPARRTVSGPDLLATLRTALGLPAHDRVSEEHAALRGRELPTLLPGLDVGAWLAWAQTGLLFSTRPQPTLRTVLGEAQRFLLTLLVSRMNGRMALVAAAAGLSPRAIRSCLHDELPLSHLATDRPREIRRPALPAARRSSARRTSASAARRDVNLDELAATVRRLLRLTADSDGAGAAIAMRHRPEGNVRQLRDVDAEGLLAWTITGAYLFAGGMPTMQAVRREAKHIAVCLAMTRGRTISHAAELLGVRRKPMRDAMRAVGLYPWPGTDVGTKPR